MSPEKICGIREHICIQVTPHKIKGRKVKRLSIYDRIKKSFFTIFLVSSLISALLGVVIVGSGIPKAHVLKA
jgi:hypothetical protein